MSRSNVFNFKNILKFLNIQKSDRNKRDTNQIQPDNSPNDQNINSSNNVNELGTCFGGLDENETRRIQEELDRAKEESDNRFSTKSRCTIQ